MLYTDPEDYFRFEACSEDAFARNAAREICMMLADRGYQLLGLEGGNWSDSGRFRPDIHTVWSKNKVAKTRDEAHSINMLGIASIDKDPEDINCYLITSDRI